jgi:hypothetical protein
MPRPNALHRLRSTSRSTRIAAGALAVGGTLVLLASSMLPSSAQTSPGVAASTSASAPAPTASSAPAGNRAVRTVTYDLGATVVNVTGFDTVEGRPAGIELAAVVHLPVDLKAGPYPLVLIQHGFHETCADRSAARAWETAYRRYLTVANTGGDATAAGRTMDAARTGLLRWPCAPGVAALPSHRGYDGLGEHLAAQGFVVVSMSANGISAGTPGSAADAARVALTGRHLAMWRELSQSGTGPLAGAFPGAAELTGAVDLRRVAGIGHVEGVRGFALAGGTLSAVVALSPPEAETEATTTVPTLALIGSCESGAVAPAGATTVTVDGANRTFTNAQWAPASGQVLAHDDVERALEAFSDVRPRAGWCRNAHDDGATKQLTETRQRDVVTAQVTAFLRKHLTR